MSSINRRSFLLAGLALAGSRRQALGETEPAGLARLRDDARLAKPVTLRLRHGRIAEALAAVEQATRVELRAAADVADEPVIALASEQPAREVMRQLAFLFNYQWRRSGPAD